MFEVGFTEIVLILGIALLVLGPEKLPKLANQVGRWAGRARAMARQLREQLDEEVTIIGKDDFGPAVQRQPGKAAAGTPHADAPPPAQPAPAPPASTPEQPGKADETPPPS
jgi:sec-independent protein translocase protein TatB